MSAGASDGAILGVVAAVMGGQLVIADSRGGVVAENEIALVVVAAVVGRRAVL